MRSPWVHSRQVTWNGVRRRYLRPPIVTQKKTSARLWRLVRSTVQSATRVPVEGEYRAVEEAQVMFGPPHPLPAMV